MTLFSRRATDVRMSEVDLSSSLTTASPATAAVVVISKRGSIIPARHTSWDRFRAAFGNPDAKTSFDHYCARDYFLGGNALYAVRAVGSGYKYSAAVLKNTTAGETVGSSITAGVVDPTDPDWGVNVLVGETALLQVTPKDGPGSYANTLSFQIESQNISKPDGITATTTTLGGSLLAATYEYVVSAISKTGETLSSSPVTVVIGAATTTNAVTLRWPAVSGAIGYRIYGRVPGSHLFIDQVGGGSSSYTDFGLVTPNPAIVPITDPANLTAASPIFVFKVYDSLVSGTTPVESFTCSVTPQTDDNGNQMEVTQRVNPYSEYLRVESNIPNLATTPSILSTGKISLAGGNSGTAPTSADINRAWSLFEDTDQYRVDMFINAGKADPSVQIGMDTVAQNRNDCVAHLDPPSSCNTAQSVVDYRNLTLNLNSSFSTLNAQYALETDPISGSLLYVPMSGLIAGLQARVARTPKPWLSIAGLNRGRLGILGLNVSFKDADATIVTNSQISYARKFSGDGIALWEANTLLGKNSALNFLNIRVLCNIVKRSVYDYLLYGLQEPGDDILRDQLSGSLNDYLETVRTGRGIKSYRVIASEVNNPASLTNSGVLRIAVVIVPTIGVREIQLTLAISKEGLEITESEIASWAA